MSELDKIEDVLSVDHRYRDEIKQWHATGKFPEEVVRDYEHDGEKNRDIARMLECGYTVAHEELTERISPLYPASTTINQSPEGIGHCLCVTYRRKSLVYESDDGSNVAD